MPFDVSGNFTRVHDWTQDRDNGIRILADRHDEEDDNFASGFNQVMLRNGSVPMTGNLNMNGKNINTLGAGTEALPSLTWTGSLSTGWYQISPNALGLSTNGVKRLEVNNTTVAIALNATVGGTLGVTGIATFTAAAKFNGGITAPLTLTGPNAAFTVNSTNIGGIINISSDAAGGSNVGSLNFQLNGVTKASISWGQGNGWTYYDNQVGQRFRAGAGLADVLLIEPATVTITPTGGMLVKGGNAALRVENTVSVNLPGASGPGVQLSQNSIDAYNPTGAVWTPLSIGASIVNIQHNAGSVNVVTSSTAQGLSVGAAAGSLTVPQLAITGTTIRWIGFGALGSAAPTIGVRSAGTKIVLVDNIASGFDYGMGAEPNYTWISGHQGVRIYDSNQAAPSYRFEHAAMKMDARAGLGSCAFTLTLTAAQPVGFYNSSGNAGITTEGTLTVSNVAGTVAYAIVHPSSGIAAKTATTAAAANVNKVDDTTGTYFARVTSSQRYKTDVQGADMAEALKMLTVPPISYKSLCEMDDPDELHYGFVAEDMEAAGLQPLVHYAYQEDQYHNVEIDDGDVEGPVRYNLAPIPGEQKRPDGVQYERIVVLQQLLINDLYARLEKAGL